MPGLLLCRVRSLFALPFPRKGCCFMARLAAVEKAGYYPTPPEEVRLICSRIKSEPGTKISILDPCCGEGDALKEMAQTLRDQGADVTTYGIELEEGRAGNARKNLDHVICSPYEDAIVTPLAFSYIWLNPPYMDCGSERAEAVFLRNLTGGSGKLQAGGLLGFCIPEHVLRDTALLLASRFEDIKVYRFTGENYPAYHQIVVFGYRRAKRPIAEEIVETKNALISLIGSRLPSLDADDGGVFDVPPSSREVKVFKPARPDPEEIRSALAASSAWRRAWELLPRVQASSMKRPVLPLKPAHIAVAIAAGAVGGSMGDHVLVGRADKVLDKTVIPEEDGTTEIQTERVVTTVRVFTQNGVYDLR